MWLASLAWNAQYSLLLNFASEGALPIKTFWIPVAGEAKEGLLMSFSLME
jgi:hypothetical protein